MNYDLNNALFVAVGTGTARTTKTKITELADGEVVLAGENGNILLGNTAAYAAATLPSKLQIVSKRDGDLFKSQAFKPSEILSYTVSDYTASTPQITYIGYNGTSGQLEADANMVGSTDYVITLRRLDTLQGEFVKMFNNKSAQWYSGDTITTPTEKLLAQGLYESMDYAWSGNIDGYIKTEMISSNLTDVALIANATVVNGEKAITSAGHALVAGDFVRIGGTTSTTPVYIVESAVSANVFTLTTPYAGDSGTVLLANISKITTPTTGSYGIKITTVDKYFDVGRFDYDVFKFDVWLNNNFLNTPITYSQASTKGTGEYEEIASIEWKAQHSQRFGDSEYNMPPKSFPLNAASGANYDILVVRAKADSEMFVTGTHTQYKTIMVGLKTETGGGNEQALDDTAGDPVGIAIGLDKWLLTLTGVDPNQDSNITT